MPLENGEDGDRELIDALYRSMEKPERRRILFGLLDHNPQDALLAPEGVHSAERDVERINLALVHHHLPLLEDAGLVRWDREADELHKGPKFEAVSDLIEATRDHDPRG